MQRPQVFLGLVYLCLGIFFSFHSARGYSQETHWGYALTGIACLFISGRFLGLPLDRNPFKQPGRLD